MQQLTIQDLERLSHVPRTTIYFYMIAKEAIEVMTMTATAVK